MTKKERLFKKIEEEYTQFLDNCKTKTIEELADMSLDISIKKVIHDLIIKDDVLDCADIETISHLIHPLETLSDLWHNSSNCVSDDSLSNEDILVDSIFSLQKDYSLYSKYETENEFFSGNINDKGMLTARVIKKPDGKFSVVVEFIPDNADEGYIGPMVIVNTNDDNQLQCHVYKSGDFDEVPVTIDLDIK